MNDPNLNNALVRILADDREPRQPVGAGFLVSARHILTCAHVVEDALRIPNHKSEQPAEPVFLDFPLLDGQPFLHAKVLKWYPVRDNAVVGEVEDIAVLELSSDNLPLLPDACPVPVVVMEVFFDRPVRMFGFSVDEGTYVNGKLHGMTGKGWVEINPDPGSGGIAPGFSGTAVWDKGENAVAGMVVSRRGEKLAYMIPAATLIRAFPEIDEHSRPPNPYRGLEVFREKHAEFFFGREIYTEKLLKSVQAGTLVALIGASGSGKSSVVYAGLIPLLRRQGNWQIAVFRPGDRPLHALSAAAVRLLEPGMSRREQRVETNKMAENFRKGDIGFRDILEDILGENPDFSLLLFADQFEELYTSCRKESDRRCFLDELLSVTGSDMPRWKDKFRFVLTMRADFLGKALSYRPFADALQDADLKLGPMRREELRRVIENPANRLGVKAEEGLTERILDAVKDEPGNLPLLEFALRELWEKQQFRTLSNAAYDAIGGVEKALTAYADCIYERLKPEEQEKARYVFTQLVRPGQGTEDTRRVAARSDIGEENWEVVTKLADSRLVVTGGTKETGDKAEVVHEALIKQWGYLQKWIDEDREFRIWQEHLRERIREWEASKHDKGALLRGAPLAKAEEWLKGRELRSEERDFIETSLQLRDQEIAEREAQQQRELETAKKLEREARKREQAQRKSAQRLKILLVIIFVSALIAVFLWRQADTQTEIAKQKNYRS